MQNPLNQVSRRLNNTPSGKSQGRFATREALDAMVFNSSALLNAAAGLAADLEKGKKLTRRQITVGEPDPFDPEIAAIRKKLDMSQSVFAAVLGVTPASVMSWEYGRRTPSGPVRRLLHIASRQPQILLEFA
ncbi:MAG: helix-turn-helix domain-containing protein [Verrucomicrobiota bacterium]